MEQWYKQIKESQQRTEKTLTDIKDCLLDILSALEEDSDEEDA